MKKCTTTKSNFDEKNSKKLFTLKKEKNLKKMSLKGFEPVAKRKSRQKRLTRYHSATEAKLKKNREKQKFWRA